MTGIDYPEPLPEGREIKYVPQTHPYMLLARAHALTHSLDDAVKTGSVVVKDGILLGRGANGSDYHKTHECEREKLKKAGLIRTGEGYDKCEGCHPKNHSETRAIEDAKSRGFDPRGADLYLWGHWWCCAPCWKAINEAGIRDVFLVEKSEILFRHGADGNILGKW